MIPLDGGFQMRAHTAFLPGPLSWRAMDSSCRVPGSLCMSGDSRIQSRALPGKGRVLPGSAEERDRTPFLSAFLRPNCAVVASAGSMVIRLHTKALHTKDHDGAILRGFGMRCLTPELWRRHAIAGQSRPHDKGDRRIDRGRRFRESQSATGRAHIVRCPRNLRGRTSHSKMMAWLLDPTESHGLGSKALRRFLYRAAKLAHAAKVDFGKDGVPIT